MQESNLYQDEDLKVITEACIELLFSAGYYKAKLVSLDVFDKIVGGMLWCLSVTEAEITSDLVVAEKTTIKERIYITEQIIKALNYIQCPYKIEPHQIEGYDIFNIHPILKVVSLLLYANAIFSGLLSRVSRLEKQYGP